MTVWQRRNRTKVDTFNLYMDAAEALFIRGGYEGASIRDIAKESGALLHYIEFFVLGFGSHPVLPAAAAKSRRRKRL
jgi:hypothetical protein